MFIYRIILEVSYLNIVSPLFAYTGFYTSFSFGNYFLSWLIFLNGFMLCSHRISRVSDFFFLTSFIMILTPLCVLYGLDSGRSLFTLAVSVSSFWLVYFFVNANIISFNRVQIFRNGLSFVIVISSFFTLFLIVWYIATGVTLNFNPLKVYDYRLENRALAGGGILNYITPWTYKIFTMTLLSIALLFRRYVIAVLIIFIQFFFYAASAHKSVILSPLLILFLYFYIRKNNSAVIFPAALSALITIAIGTFYAFDDIFTSSIVIRRLFFVPSDFTYNYFEFFSSNPKVFWSNSFLSLFFDYPYNTGQPIAIVIGEFMGYPEQNANSGYISTGFAHAGLFGVFIYSTIIGLTLRFLNHSAAKFLPLWFILALFVVPLAQLILASDLLVVFLTHGLIIALIIITLLRSKKYAKHSQ